jgi:CRISPR-associated protein Cmr2
MSHLLAISVGPVQEFIAAARRTRDLWFGSYLLSEISREVARAVEGPDRQLIFPASSDAENVANVILAKLDAGDPKEIAAKAKEAARKRWQEFAEQARGEAFSVIREVIWKDQVDDVIEFYAAWVPHTDPDRYQEDRRRVMRLLAGRKNCRDFKQPGFNDTGLPKSSLDGQRPTVLVGPKPGEPRATYRDNWPKKLRLAPGEQLDVVGITKRLGKKRGESDPRYPSVARVAAETWLRGVKDRASFKELSDACAAVPELNKVAEPNYDYFPYEGTVIFKDRHTDLIAELGEGVREPLKRVAGALGKLGGEPTPYVAVLVADGDGMGAVISNQKTIDDHQRFSQELARFASEARKIVTNHNGVLVYSGGDDVLAFLPVDKCLGCAHELHNKFGDLLKEYKTGEGKWPTLSVGVAIGHFMENLEDLLEYARAAEKAAKKVEGKDALAVHLHKRGGSPIRVRGRWTDRPANRLIRYAQLIQEEAIPGKLPYDLRALADLYAGWRSDAKGDKQQLAEAIKSDVLRVIRDKQPRSGRRHMAEIEGLLNAVNDVADLRRLAAELLVARQIAPSLRQAGGQPTETAEVAP